VITHHGGVIAGRRELDDLPVNANILVDAGRSPRERDRVGRGEQAGNA
jgi:hypothetical protein